MNEEKVEIMKAKSIKAVEDMGREKAGLANVSKS